MSSCYNTLHTCTTSGPESHVPLCPMCAALPHVCLCAPRVPLCPTCTSVPQVCHCASHVPLCLKCATVPHVCLCASSVPLCLTCASVPQVCLCASSVPLCPTCATLPHVCHFAPCVPLCLTCVPLVGCSDWSGNNILPAAVSLQMSSFAGVWYNVVLCIGLCTLNHFYYCTTCIAGVCEGDLNVMVWWSCSFLPNFKSINICRHFIFYAIIHTS